MSSIVPLHGPPIGPIGLLCFAAAVALLARAQGTQRPVDAAAPATSDSPDRPPRAMRVWPN